MKRDFGFRPLLINWSACRIANPSYECGVFKVWEGRNFSRNLASGKAIGQEVWRGGLVDGAVCPRCPPVEVSQKSELSEPPTVRTQVTNVQEAIESWHLRSPPLANVIVGLGKHLPRQRKRFLSQKLGDQTSQAPKLVKAQIVLVPLF